MKTLTVVVPSYNTEKYIDECLPTMISDKSIDNIEVLLINDGSTDGTLDKIKQYEQQYPNSIRVVNKENGGHGSVINFGIQEANGKYFKVIDGDDWVDTESFNRLVNCLKVCNADLVLNPFIMHNIVTNIQTTVGLADIDNGATLKFDTVTDRLPLLALHGITYKTAILRENKIHLQEKCFYEDAEYYIYPVQYIEDLTYLDYPVYIYRIGSPTQSVSPQNAVRNKDMLSTIVDNLINFFTRLPKDISKTKKGYITKQICHIIQNMYGVYLKMPIGREAYNGMHEFDEKLKSKSEELYDASGTVVIKALRIHAYPVYIIGVKMFEKKRQKRGF